MSATPRLDRPPSAGGDPDGGRATPARPSAGEYREEEDGCKKGEVRFADMPILADALEEAGCADAAILGHCRGGGEHVRGCWVVDLLTGRG
jgi:hypothetical protein